MEKLTELECQVPTVKELYLENELRIFYQNRVAGK